MPRTKSGKLVEIAVRTIVNGGTVAETGALDERASALDEFVDHPCLAPALRATLVGQHLAIRTGVGYELRV